MTESFFKIKTLKSLQEVIDHFLNVKNIKSPKKVMQFKNFKTMMVSFFSWES